MRKVICIKFKWDRQNLKRECRKWANLANDSLFTRWVGFYVNSGLEEKTGWVL